MVKGVGLHKTRIRRECVATKTTVQRNRKPRTKLTTITTDPSPTRATPRRELNCAFVPTPSFEPEDPPASVVTTPEETSTWRMARLPESACRNNDKCVACVGAALQLWHA
jgi:hypothetical protein